MSNLPLDLQDLQRKALAASKVEIVTTDTGGAFRNPEDAAVWGRFASEIGPATVLELIAEVQTLRGNQSHLEELEAALRAEITALKAQRDEMAEVLGWIEAQAKAFAQSKMSEQTRSGIRASAWNWVFAVEQKVADIQRRARSSLNKEKTDG